MRKMLTNKGGGASDAGRAVHENGAVVLVVLLRPVQKSNSKRGIRRSQLVRPPLHVHVVHLKRFVTENMYKEK